MAEIHPHAVKTRYLTREELIEMLNWIETNVHSRIAMARTAYWQDKAEVLSAHRKFGSVCSSQRREDILLSVSLVRMSISPSKPCGVNDVRPT